MSRSSIKPGDPEQHWPWLDPLLDEIERADAKYGPFVSTHEGYGVLAEEVAELLEAIRINQREDIEREALQVAAVAIRLAESLGSETMRKRSGCEK